QGRGMERWLAMELSQRLGVWANPDFPFPRRLIDRIIIAVLGTDGSPTAAFEPEALMWSLADLLPHSLGKPELAPVGAYLADDPRHTKCIAPAQRLADTFDHYVVYRPEILDAWERSEDGGWQGVLWRGVVQRHGRQHLAARAHTALAALAGRRDLAHDL